MMSEAERRQKQWEKTSGPQFHTLQSMEQMNSPLLKPTLWRTCRVLANRTRLRALGLLVCNSPLTVSAMAMRLHLPMPVASQCLRSLEARGLLTARRVKQRVDYRLNDTPMGDARELVAALRSAFRSEADPEDIIYRLSTAFTHPRRIEIFHSLQERPRTLTQLGTLTSISGPALVRHLEKLKTRGFVICEKNIYSAMMPTLAFGRTLARLASK